MLKKSSIPKLWFFFFAPSCYLLAAERPVTPLSALTERYQFFLTEMRVLAAAADQECTFETTTPEPNPESNTESTQKKEQAQQQPPLFDTASETPASSSSPQSETFYQTQDRGSLSRDSSQCLRLLHLLDHKKAETLILHTKLQQDLAAPHTRLLLPALALAPVSLDAKYLNKINNLKEKEALLLSQSEQPPYGDEDGDSAKLWQLNDPLSAAQFYHKYQSDFEQYGIRLQFTEQSKHPQKLPETLIDQLGRRHPKILWESDMERWLTSLTGHPHKAHVLSEAFYRHLYPLTHTHIELNQFLIWFLFRYHYYLSHEPQYLRWRMGLYQELSPFFNGEKWEAPFDAFLAELQAAFQPVVHPPAQPQANAQETHEERHKVLIITGSYGSGHQSAASTINHLLQKDPQVVTQTVNECLDLSDPLSIATGGLYRSCQTFTHFTYQEGNKRKATLINILNLKLGEYIPNTHFQELAEITQKAAPHQLISTIHHIEGVTSLAYFFQIPLNIIITDYEFPHSQWFHLNHLDPELVHYSIPAVHSNFFRPLFEKYISQHWDAKIPGTRTRMIWDKFFTAQQEEIFHSVLESLGVFHYLPFPVAPQIRPPENQEEILASRKALGLSLDLKRKVLALAYGGEASTNEITQLIEKILKLQPKLEHPVELAILSAGNAEVKQRISQLLTRAGIPLTDLSPKQGPGTSPPITAKILDRLSYQEEMPHLYRASDLFISKSGGATSSELIESQVYFIRGFKLWPWEIENTQHLESLGLAIPESRLTDANPELKTEKQAIRDFLARYALNVSEASLLYQITETLKLPRRLQKKVSHPQVIAATHEMETLMRLHALDPKLAHKQIAQLSHASKKEKILAYLESFQTRLSAADQRFTLKFQQFLKMTEVLLPELHLPNYFHPAHSRPLPSALGLKALLPELTQATLFPDEPPAPNRIPVSVLSLSELPSALAAWRDKAGEEEAAWIVVHEDHHLTSVLGGYSAAGRPQLVLSDARGGSDEAPWLRAVIKQLAPSTDDTSTDDTSTDDDDDKNETIATSSAGRPAQDLYVFQAPRTTDHAHSFVVALHDVMEQQKESLFPLLDHWKQYHPAQVIPSQQHPLLHYLKTYPDAWMKITPSLSQLKDNHHAWRQIDLTSTATTTETPASTREIASSQVILTLPSPSPPATHLPPYYSPATLPFLAGEPAERAAQQQPILHPLPYLTSEALSPAPLSGNELPTSRDDGSGSEAARSTTPLEAAEGPTALPLPAGVQSHLESAWILGHPTHVNFYPVKKAYLSLGLLLKKLLRDSP